MPETDSRGDAPIVLKILVLTTAPGNADEELHNAVADVLKAVSTGDATFGQLVLGGLFADTYEAESALDDGGAGNGEATVTLKGQMLWSATAP